MMDCRYQLTKANEWHAAVLMRKGVTMWIFDPAFDLNKLPKDGLLAGAKALYGWARHCLIAAAESAFQLGGQEDGWGERQPIIA